jgi:hypothetical protein
MKTQSTIRKLLTGLIGASAAMMATTASAALPQGWSDTLPAWTATASSCSTDENTAGKYEFAGAQFRFLGSNVSNASTGSLIPVYQPITVRCNVAPVHDYVPATTTPAPDPGGIAITTPADWVSANWNAMIVSYKDPDGMGTGAQFTATLKKINRTTFAESTVASFNSNTKAVLTASQDVKTFSQVIDFSKFEYYVEINLVRTSAAVATPVAYSVRLTNGSVAVVPQ